LDDDVSSAEYKTALAAINQRYGPNPDDVSGFKMSSSLHHDKTFPIQRARFDHHHPEARLQLDIQYDTITLFFI
jgi:hypothetical protein